MFNYVFALFVCLVSLAPAFAADEPAIAFAERQKPMFQLMQVEEAWKITRGGPGCVVGVIDSGFDFFHPALKDSLKPGWFAPGVYHTDFYAMDAHGTLVASLIAARHGEGENGMSGLAPDCTVLAAAQGMPVHRIALAQREFFNRNPKATMAEWLKEIIAHGTEFRSFTAEWLEYVFGTVAEGVRYLADRGVRVINISEYLDTAMLATRSELRARLDAAFSYAKQKDVLIVLGAGNNDNRVTDYPGDRDFVLVAGASTMADKRWSMSVNANGTEVRQGSCYGPRLNVMAPVENIVVADPHEGAYYSWKDTPMGPMKLRFAAPYEALPWGATSSAAPQVAALAALVRSLRPELKASAVRDLIERGADDIGAAGVDEETGHGRINFRRTLELAVAAHQ